MIQTCGVSTRRPGAPSTRQARGDPGGLIKGYIGCRIRREQAFLSVSCNGIRPRELPLCPSTAMLTPHTGTQVSRLAPRKVPAFNRDDSEPGKSLLPLSCTRGAHVTAQSVEVCQLTNVLQTRGSVVLNAQARRISRQGCSHARALTAFSSSHGFDRTVMKATCNGPGSCAIVVCLPFLPAAAAVRARPKQARLHGATSPCVFPVWI